LAEAQDGRIYNPKLERDLPQILADAVRDALGKEQLNARTDANVRGSSTRLS
jgi:hypothetical protein